MNAAPSTNATPTLTDSVALFERSTTAMLDVLATITVADLDRPTPCTQWDVRTLLLHVADVADAFGVMATTGEFVLTPVARADAYLALATQQRLQILRETLAAPPVPNRDDHEDNVVSWLTNTAQAGAIEYATHTWDIARALGVDALPEGLAAEVLALATALIADDSRPPVFGPRLAAAETSPASEQLAAEEGRRP